MLQIDYMGLLKDLGIKDRLFENIKKSSNLSDQQIEKIYQEKVEYHGDKMNQYMEQYLSQYLNLKKEGKTDVDQQLDAMVSDYLNKNSQVK